MATPASDGLLTNLNHSERSSLPSDGRESVFGEIFTTAMYGSKEASASGPVLTALKVSKSSQAVIYRIRCFISQRDARYVKSLAPNKFFLG